MKAVILHAYSTNNSGDGLLVREAIRLLSQAAPDIDTTVFALDPDSFERSSTVSYIHPLTGQGKSPTKLQLLVAALRAMLHGARIPSALEALIADADIVIGVGGGYLRASTPVEAIKMLVSHYPQLRSGALNRSTVYLSQSIGPLRLGTAGLLSRRLAKISTVFVRDQRSFDDLAPAVAVQRAPDTATLALAAGLTTTAEAPKASRSGVVGLVARSVLGPAQRRKKYLGLIKSTRARTSAELLLQSRGRGNNDDAFYASAFGEPASRTVREATTSEARRADVVISVRLHGAIETIRNGVPAVHLSYERKGWGAFEDLGISEYVHNAFDFDVSQVVRQANELAANPDKYWENVDASRDALGAAEKHIVATIKGAIDEV